MPDLQVKHRSRMMKEGTSDMDIPATHPLRGVAGLTLIYRLETCFASQAVASKRATER